MTNLIAAQTVLSFSLATNELMRNRSLDEAIMQDFLRQGYQASAHEELCKNSALNHVYVAKEMLQVLDPRKHDDLADLVIAASSPPTGSAGSTSFDLHLLSYFRSAALSIYDPCFLDRADIGHNA